MPDPAALSNLGAMRRQLIRHPAFPCDAVQAIEVEVRRRPRGRLDLRYRLSGVTEALVLPPPAQPARADELWRHTCLEAFVGEAASPGYLEFNLAPSTQWAAYRFEGPRAGMAPAEVAPPDIRINRSGGRLELAATLAPPLDGGPWRLGLSAVIGEAGGRISYWALRHPPARPDFHDPDCFVLELPAPEAP